MKSAELNRRWIMLYYVLYGELNLTAYSEITKRKSNNFMILMVTSKNYNIGLADTLIPSSFLYLIYMGGTGSCELMTIIFRRVIKS